MVKNIAPATAQFEKAAFEGFVESYEVERRSAGEDGKEVLGKEQLRVNIDKSGKTVPFRFDMGNYSVKFGWTEKEFYDKQTGGTYKGWVAPWSSEYASLKKAAMSAGVWLIEDYDEYDPKKIGDKDPLIKINSVSTDPGQPRLEGMYIKVGVIKGTTTDEGKEIRDRYNVLFVGSKAPNAQKTLDEAKAPENAPARRSREEATKVEAPEVPTRKAAEAKSSAITNAKTGPAKVEAPKVEKPLEISDDLVLETIGYVKAMLDENEVDEIGKKQLRLNVRQFAWGVAGKAAFIDVTEGIAYNNFGTVLQEALNCGMLIMTGDGIGFPGEE